MRLFTALSLDSTQKREIYEWRESQLPKLSPSTPPDNYHMTLAFYGEIQSGQIEALAEHLDAAIKKLNPPMFQLSLDELSYWPHKNMLWLCPKVWPQALEDLANKQRQIGTKFGVKKSTRKYLPHISLARNLIAPPADLPKVDIPVCLNKITLFESNRGDSRMHYHSLMDWPL